MYKEAKTQVILDHGALIGDELEALDKECIFYETALDSFKKYTLGTYQETIIERIRKEWQEIHIPK